MTEGRAYALARGVAVAVALVFLAAAALLALTIPFHDHDALSYGEWSRLIAQTWHIRFPSITDQTYHRPLFSCSIGGAPRGVTAPKTSRFAGRFESRMAFRPPLGKPIPLEQAVRCPGIPRRHA
jgi:hypothetical protein